MKDMKWARGLNRKLVNTILDFEPESVEFYSGAITVSCTIQVDESERASGFAICSTLDEFDYKKGKNIAAGRAVKALVRKSDNDKVRNDLTMFPNTWTMAQVRRLQNFGGLSKSAYRG